MRKKCIISAIILLVIFNIAGVPAGKAAAGEELTSDRLEQALDSIVKETMAMDRIPGVAVVVTMNDRIIFSKGFGYADIDLKIPIDPGRTIMPMGSLTKNLTATAIMQLWEQGKVSMEQDVNSYLTSFQIPLYRKQTITLHHLLTHTAGLDEALYGVSATSLSGTVSQGEYLKRYFSQQPPIRTPGTEYAYSNAGFGLAAYVLEEVSGNRLEDYLTCHVFEPLEMPSATLNASESSEMARSYTYHNGKYKQLPNSYVNMPGAGGISAVPEEWAHYMIAHLNDGVYRGQRILRSGTIKVMHASQFSEHPDLEGMGYGFFRTRTKNGLLTLWHNGDIDGFSAKMELIPSRKIGILVIANAASKGVSVHDKVTAAVADMLSGQDKQGSLRNVTPAEDLRQYERTYTMTLGPLHGWGKWFRWLGAKDFQVKSTGDHLVIRGEFPGSTGGLESRIFKPIGKNLFQDQAEENTVTFHQENKIWKLTFTQGVTISDKPPWWLHPKTAFVAYVALSLFWILVFMTGMVRYLLRFIRRKRQQLPGPVAWMASLFTVYSIGQLLYGNSEVFTRGYPAWYAWGFSSLPFLALIGAVILGIQVIRSRKSVNSDTGKKRLRARFSVISVILCLAYTWFLFYWNMLSIHYT